MPDITPESGKAKKTRRRLRLSCVECTKRRQKCDRNHPCGLCVSRGVAHLCRWETVPMARPSPSRPPETAMRYLDGIAQHDAIVKELLDRIAILEEALGTQGTGTPLQMDTPSTSSSSFRSTPLPDSKEGSTSRDVRGVSQPPPISPNYSQLDIATTIPNPLAETLYESVATLCHLCLAQHGEYIGRGSLMCALHSITTRTTPRFIYAKSTDAIFEGRGNMERFSPLPYASHNVQQLLLKLPQRTVYDALIESYFFNINWRYGIPREWFNRASAQMWSKIHTSPAQSSEINANFLMLVFSFLAVAPRESPELGASVTPLSNDDYFMCAMIARRMAEDDYFSTPGTSTMVSPADGSVLGCLAIPIIANFLSERGRASEAWKLVGTGLRNAYAVGMHRDPDWEHWQVMSADEKLLRRRGWWSLFNIDRFLSYIFGRPPMIQGRMYDVQLPRSTDEDGTFDLFGYYQRVMIELASLMGEAMEECYNIEYPLCSDFIAMEDRFKLWRQSVPLEYQASQEISFLQGYQDSEIFNLARQRYILNSWYLIGRLKLHIASTTGALRVTQLPADLARCRALCVSAALELINYQCDFHDSLMLQSKESQNLHHAYLASGWLFHGCFSLFEACVALLAVRERLSEDVPEAMGAFDRTLATLAETAKHARGKEGSVATIAIRALGPLREQLSRFEQRPSSGRFDGDGLAMKSLFDGTDPSSSNNLNWLAGSISQRDVIDEGYVYGEGYSLG